MKLFKIEVENGEGIQDVYYEYAFDEVVALRDTLENKCDLKVKVKQVKRASMADLLDAAVAKRKGA